MKKELGIFILLVVLCTVIGSLNHNFFSPTNLRNLALLVGIYGIFSIGLGMVIITSGIDLSVGSVFAFQGVLLSIMLVDRHIPWPIAVGLLFLSGLVLGLINGLLVTRARLQPFVVTLCGLLIYRGLARFIAHDESKGFGSAEGFEGLHSFLTGYIANVPIAFLILLVVAAISGIFLHRSVFGRYLYAVGRNEDAARYSGINTKNVVTTAYVICSVLTVLAGILLAFYTNSISPSTHGSFYELYGIAAAVLGGCSLRGGEGSILGILLGTILIQVLQNAVNLLGVDSSLNYVVMGGVILVGVLADQLLKNRVPKVTSPATTVAPTQVKAV